MSAHKSSPVLAHRHDTLLEEEFPAVSSIPATLSNTFAAPSSLKNTPRTRSFLSRGGNKSRKNRPRYQSPRTATAVSDARRTREREREREREEPAFRLRTPASATFSNSSRGRLRSAAREKPAYERRMRAVTPLRQGRGNPGERRSEVGGQRGRMREWVSEERRREKKMEMGQQ